MLVLAVLAASTIWVSAPADPACALADGVTRSLAELMPEATVRAGEVAGTGDLIVHVALRLDGIDVEVSDERGGVLLVRTLPRRGSCSETAEAIALIVERYLTDLGWQPATVAVPPRAPDPASASAHAAAAPPPRGPRPRAEIVARGLLALGPAQLGGALEAALGRGRLRLAIEAGALAPRALDVTRTGGAAVGELEISSIHALAGAGAGLGRVHLMLRAGGERLDASAAGDGVFQRVDRGSWQVLVRADAGVRLALTPAVSIEPWAALELRPQPVEITVEGAAGTYSYPRLRAVMGAGAVWTFR